MCVPKVVGAFDVSGGYVLLLLEEIDVFNFSRLLHCTALEYFC